jgi:antirestriction protein ArdC
LAATINRSGNRAYYAKELDYAQMPPFEAFGNAASYYATLAHKLTHWTRHPQRLDRDFGRKSWVRNVAAASNLLRNWDLGSCTPTSNCNGSARG